MTEATPRPWTGDDSHAADRDGVQIWAGDVIIADVIPDHHDNEIANAAFILKAVNSHDALVAACEAMRDSGMFDWEGAIAYEEEAALVMAALEAAK